MDGKQVIQVLNQTIDWYRTLAVEQQAATEPSDLLILNENRQIAREVIGLAFIVARADADLLVKQAAAAPAPAAAAGPAQALAQLQAKLNAQESAVQSELASNQQKLAAAPKKAGVQLQGKIAELQGELELIHTKKSIVASMAGFETGGTDNSTANALRAQIDAMAVALPVATGVASGVSNATSANAPSANPVPAQAAAASSSTTTHGTIATPLGPLAATTATVVPTGSRFGLWDLAANVFRLSQKMSTIGSIDQRTADLQSTLNQIRARLIDQMRALSARGDALIAQADTADSAALNQIRDQLDAIADQFKQLSAIFIPLSKENLLLNQSRHNLENWRDTIKEQSRDALKILGVRVAVLAVMLAILIALGELSRRAVLRYVQDSRRRYQLLLLRSIAFWALVALIVGFAFASELGSIVTFAGLITAGLAVAMQSVLVSIVGYFFLIGKYGIRVGDRVQIGEVNGEVIDLGLVRMYLMEFGGHGSLGPTGRVVAFPNSVVFQVSTGLFKQIPGVNLAWHEITLSLPSGVDYQTTKERLTAAVIDALKDYQDDIKRQAQELQRATLSGAGGEALPTVQLHYSASGVEAQVRYPVHLRHAAEIDERVSHALVHAVSGMTPPDSTSASTATSSNPR
jgi:small-conductance mechanosensitive channel